jgi:hypothetical protein
MPKTHADGTVTDASAPVVEPLPAEEAPAEVVVTETDTEDDSKPAPKRKTARKTRG